MVISHNLSAMNANRMLSINGRKRASVIEKLSSGYKINRAADDAAGLAISEKMRRQIRGLTQASKNAQDGISLVQIADGALAEVQDMLHRGTELSVKAANGTLTDQDRAYIQEEIEQLKKEIDGISDRTTFNEIQVLKGKDVPVEEEHSNVVITGGLPAWVKLGSQKNMEEVYETTETYTDANGVEQTATITHEAATIDFSAFDGSPAMLDELKDKGFYSTCCTCSNHYSIKFVSGTASSMEKSGTHNIYNIGIDGVTTPEELMQRIIDGTDQGNPLGHYTKFAMDAGKTNLIVYDDRSNSAKDKNGTLDLSTINSWKNWSNSGYTATASGDYGKFGPGIAISKDDAARLSSPSETFIQVGAEPGQHIDIELPSISSRNIGIKHVDVRTQDGAGQAITSFKSAIEYVSRERSRMGAYQNRLEHTIKNLDNVIENTQAAESQLRDADMAELMVEFATTNIIEQFGQSMLAQTNQSGQGVLALLG